MAKPLLDVTEVITDPNFADDFQVIRRVQDVDDHGEPFVRVITTYNSIGVCTPSGDQSLVRADAYEAQSNALQVITKFRLRGAAVDNGTGFLPDLVVWQKGSYVVKSVDDYSRFGAGFVVAGCILQDYIPMVSSSGA
jgi:hypothetical protein